MKNSTRQDAEKMVLESITGNIDFSIEFYKREIEEEKAKGNDFLAEHCAEMVKAYTTLKFIIEHFKF